MSGLTGLNLVGKTMTGKQFNKIFKKTKFVKMTNMDENHNGYKFKDGLNIDTSPFYPYDECTKGGIYFTDFKKRYTWFYYWTTLMKHIRKVTIPNDAQVYVEKDKFKADKIFLGPKKVISKKDYLNALKEGHICFEVIPDYFKSRKLCMDAVGTTGRLLKYVPEHFRDHTMCMRALNNTIVDCVLEYIPQKLRSKEICIKGVKHNGHELKHVPEYLKDKNICRLAVYNTVVAFKYVSDNLKDKDMCTFVVSKLGFMLKYVPESFKDKEMCMLAIQNSADAFKYVPDNMKDKKM